MAKSYLELNIEETDDSCGLCELWLGDWTEITFKGRCLLFKEIPYDEASLRSGYDGL